MINEVKMVIWDREFTLKINYDLYDDEKIIQSQIDLLNAFIKDKNILLSAKQEAEKYCASKVNEDASNQKKDNIFSYIKPDYIFVKHDESKPRLGLMCKYKYDPEHGLVVVYEKNGAIKVGPQDIIL